MVPEPAAYYEATRSAGTPKVLGEPPHPFVKEPSFDVAPGAVGLYKVGQPLGEQPLRAEHITETNYRRYAARYAASGVAEPPPLFKYASLAIAPKDGLGEGKSFAIASKELLVPDDYRLSSYSFGISALRVNYPKLSVQVMADFWPILSVPGGAPMQTAQRGDVKADDARATGPIALSVVCYDVLAFALNVQAVCTRTDEAMEKWRNQTFENLQTAYDTLQAAYDEKLTQAQAAAGIEIEGQNPALNRVVEKTELKKLCITMMTGQHYSMFGATQPPDDPATPPEVDVLTTLDQGPVIQFFEQAFEWDQLTYLFYPYFWGRKSNWRGLANSRDPDPLFQDFLSAGAARVLVPVPLAYMNDVLYLLQNPMKETQLAKKVCGGDAPLLADLRYESIADELRNRTDDLADATPEGPSWEFTLPTTLVWLQPDGQLPTFPDKP